MCIFIYIYIYIYIMYIITLLYIQVHMYLHTCNIVFYTKIGNYNYAKQRICDKLIRMIRSYFVMTVHYYIFYYGCIP